MKLIEPSVEKLPLKPGSLFKDEWEYVCNRYRDRFVEMYFTYDDGSQADTDWVAGRVGEMLDINECEYVFDMTEVRLCVDNSYNWKDVQEWWDYTFILKSIDDSIVTPNLESWMKGCPRRSKEEIDELVNLHRKTIEAREELERHIKELNKIQY